MVASCIVISGDKLSIAPRVTIAPIPAAATNDIDHSVCRRLYNDINTHIILCLYDVRAPVGLCT